MRRAAIERTGRWRGCGKRSGTRARRRSPRARLVATAPGARGGGGGADGPRRRAGEGGGVAGGAHCVARGSGRRRARPRVGAAAAGHPTRVAPRRPRRPLRSAWPTSAKRPIARAPPRPAARGGKLTTFAPSPDEKAGSPGFLREHIDDDAGGPLAPPVGRRAPPRTGEELARSVVDGVQEVRVRRWAARWARRSPRSTARSPTSVAGSRRGA